MLTNMLESFVLWLDDALNWIEWQWVLHSSDICSTLVLIVMGVTVYVVFA